MTLESVNEFLLALRIFRSGWSNQIREGWDFSTDDLKEIYFELYEVSGSIILALQQYAKGYFRDKMAMILVERKLRRLVKSENYAHWDDMSEAGMCNAITNGTRHHIRVMFTCLEFLTA